MPGIMTLIRAGFLIVCALAASCRSSSTARQQTGTAAPEALAAFVGKVWTLTDQSAPLGTLRIFLPDGTMVMDSCFETYRIARWRNIDERRIEWQEDNARIEAEVAQANPGQLRLRLQLVSEVKVEDYRLVQVPFLCPESRVQAGLGRQGLL